MGCGAQVAKGRRMVEVRHRASAALPVTLPRHWCCEEEEEEAATVAAKSARTLPGKPRRRLQLPSPQPAWHTRHLHALGRKKRASRRALVVAGLLSPPATAAAGLMRKLLRRL